MWLNYASYWAWLFSLIFKMFLFFYVFFNTFYIFFHNAFGGPWWDIRGLNRPPESSLLRHRKRLWKHNSPVISAASAVPQMNEQETAPVHSKNCSIVNTVPITHCLHLEKEGAGKQHIYWPLLSLSILKILPLFCTVAWIWCRDNLDVFSCHCALAGSPMHPCAFMKGWAPSRQTYL